MEGVGARPYGRAVTSRIVLFGATGFTGELTARELVAGGHQPLLAGRDAARLRRLAQELGGLDTAVADVHRPETVAALVERGDVLITTVGPFGRWGQPALAAAVGKGAHYLDSTGEPPFIRDVFENWGPPAQAAGVGLLTAVGYDYVPGNLAAALALRDAGPAATRVDVGYFVTGQVGRDALSSGTLASAAGILFEPGFARHGGTLTAERPGLRLRSFEVEGTSRPGLSLGGSEHLALPQTFEHVRDVDVYLGWSGAASGPINVLSRTAGHALALAPVRRAAGSLTRRLVSRRAGSGGPGGPGAEARAGARTVVVAETFDAAGGRLTRAVLAGRNPYDFTAGILAWAAGRIVTTGLEGSGSLGPVAAFGLDALAEGARAAGLQRT